MTGDDRETPRSAPMVVDGGKKASSTQVSRVEKRLDRLEESGAEIILAKLSFREKLVEHFFKPSVYLPTLAAVVLLGGFAAGVASGTFSFSEAMSAIGGFLGFTSPGKPPL